uniref:ATP synthase F0 subunit 8 n=1 Tax=Ghauriana sinensis TaxID=2729071 RepID=A0A6M3R5U4_9HEMI|nr:ATP synthase F0 subunit 8 [Ghauriana sinensis]
MPQMAPIWWLSLSLIFIFSLIMFFAFIYFLKIYNFDIQTKIQLSNMNWLW